MSHEDSSERITDYYRQPHLQTEALLETLTVEAPSIILDTEYGDTAISGQRVVLETATHYELAVTSFAEVERAEVTQLLSETHDQIDRIGLVTAQVQLAMGDEAPRVGIDIYVGTNGVYAGASIEHENPNHPPRLRSRDYARECFEAASGLGLGHVWTSSLLDILTSDNSVSGTFTECLLQNGEVVMLNNTLEHYAGRP